MDVRTLCVKLMTPIRPGPGGSKICPFDIFIQKFVNSNPYWPSSFCLNIATKEIQDLQDFVKFVILRFVKNQAHQTEHGDHDQQKFVIFPHLATTFRRFVGITGLTISQFHALEAMSYFDISDLNIWLSNLSWITLWVSIKLKLLTSDMELWSFICFFNNNVCQKINSELKIVFC